MAATKKFFKTTEGICIYDLRDLESKVADGYKEDISSFINKHGKEYSMLGINFDTKLITCVALKDGKLIGAISADNIILHNGESSTEIGGLFTIKEYWHTGLGKIIHAFCLYKIMFERNVDIDKFKIFTNEMSTIWAISAGYNFLNVRYLIAPQYFGTCNNDCVNCKRKAEVKAQKMKILEEKVSKYPDSDYYDIVMELIKNPDFKCCDFYGVMHNTFDIQQIIVNYLLSCGEFCSF